MGSNPIQFIDDFGTKCYNVFVEQEKVVIILGSLRLTDEEDG